MEIRPFSKTYGGKTVLVSEGMTLWKGQIYAVIGANGSGKSTMGKILAGVIRSDQKAPVIDKACKVCYMPQKSYAFRMSTFKNIMLGGDDEKRAREYMQALDLSALQDQRADRLSGGETARMALARSLMRPYDLVILDEPCAAMDITSAIKAEELILRYREECGSAIMMITHNLKQVRRVAEDPSLNELPIVWAWPQQPIETEHFKCTPLLSTDEGVAFPVLTEKETFYHAGDLNWWHWNGDPDERNRERAVNYKREIDRMKGIHFDVAFVPLDPRQEDAYRFCMDYFMETVDADHVFPMHFWKKYELCKTYQESLKEKHPDWYQRFIPLAVEGECYSF